MGSQPEGKVSTKIMKAWRGIGAFCYKVHGSEFQPAGIPDICGVYLGRSVWCETKMPGNKPSQIQLYRMNALMNAGALCVVAYSVQQAVQMLEHIDAGHCAHTIDQCMYRTKFELSE